MIKFKIRNPALEKEVLREVNAIEYDDCTYYVSQRLNNGCMFKHALFDKKTGLMVCYGKTKKELINKYNEVKDRYKNLFGGKLYKEYIEKYEQLKRDEQLIKEVNV